MLEMLHAVITSLLLSATMGCGTDKVATNDEDPGGTETGVEVGTMPSHLALRGQVKAEQGDDHQPASTTEQASFCEPSVWVVRPIEFVQSPAQAAAFCSAGRSP